jgi:hypothetical protein
MPRLKLGGQRHQLGGVAAQALELVDGEDDRRLRRGLLELVGQRERLLQLGPHLDAGADLLGEDLEALRPVKGFELAGQLLPGGRRTRVPDPRRPLSAGRGHGGERRTLLPRAAGPAVGRHQDFEFLAQCGHEDESRGVVLRGGLAAPGATGAARRGLAVRTVVAFYRQRCLIGRLLPERAASHPWRQSR